VQTAGKQNAFREAWQDYVSPAGADYELYGAMRQAVPIIDAALDKIVRLCGDFHVVCLDGSAGEGARDRPHAAAQAALDGFVEGVRVGAGGFGLRQFAATYLDSLLTYGNAVGEIILDAEGRDIVALYNAGLKDIRIRPGKRRWTWSLRRGRTASTSRRCGIRSWCCSRRWPPRRGR
jgi:hypothetical protein